MLILYIMYMYRFIYIYIYIYIYIARAALHSTHFIFVKQSHTHTQPHAIICPYSVCKVNSMSVPNMFRHIHSQHVPLHCLSEDMYIPACLLLPHSGRNRRVPSSATTRSSNLVNRLKPWCPKMWHLSHVQSLAVFSFASFPYFPHPRLLK